MGSNIQTLPSPIDLDEFCEDVFDYLIIGGGTAGLVVANRLSENPEIRVGVLEAGPAAFDEPLINIPGRFGESLGTKYDWQFETTPQAGIGGRKLPWPRGKVLGGTSALNFMTWNRGCKEDYDAWRDLGNQGWGWDDLLPFFKKSECFEPPVTNADKDSLYFNCENHGTEGPISSIYSKEFGASHQYWHSTLNTLGVETNKNHFGGSNVGAWTSLTSVEQDTRTRCYSANGYYLTVASRPNLKVLTEAFVEQVTIKEISGEWTATGAKFTKFGKEYHVKTRREVIICAGSVQSPQLLEVSGVGNAAILNAAGIEVKVSNPNVGENLQEHMMTATIYEILPEIATPDDLRASPELLAAAMKLYTGTASGPLTQIPSSIAYLPFSSAIPPARLDRIVAQIPPSLPAASAYSSLRQKILSDRFKPDSNLGQIEFNFDTSNYSPYFTAEPGKKYATMLQMLQYPFSTGSIHIPASDTRATMHDKPVIDPKYYQGEGGEVDLQTMIASQAFAHGITTTAPLSSIIVKRVFPPPPPAGKEDTFEDYLRNYTITDWHPVGTCAMGPFSGEEEIGGGVVDARLKVHGVRGLRVVDASVMPLQVSAHIQATVYAIGEKGASLILEDFAKTR